MTKVDSLEFCIDCNEPLEIFSSNPPKPPCPKCGSTKRKRVIVANEKVVHRETLDIIHEGEHTKRSYSLIILSLILGIVASVIGYFIAGIMGTFAGIVIGLVSFYVGMDSTVKEKFKNHFHKE